MVRVGQGQLFYPDTLEKKQAGVTVKEEERAAFVPEKERQRQNQEGKDRTGRQKRKTA